MTLHGFAHRMHAIFIAAVLIAHGTMLTASTRCDVWLLLGDKVVHIIQVNNLHQQKKMPYMSSGFGRHEDAVEDLS